MRVFAEFFKENEIEYRTKTILQFGDSWDLIGSIVMKNPGSSTPKNIGKIEGDVLNKIKKNYFTKDFDKINWHQFDPDPTMYQIEKIFNGSYVYKETKKLTGVILIFNLFNIRENNISKAQKLHKIALKNNSIYLCPNETDVLKLFNNKPVFIAFHYEWVWKANPNNKLLGKKIFEYVKNSNFMYLKDVMVDNSFYHPNYLNRPNIYRQSEIQNLLLSFFKFFN